MKRLLALVSLSLSILALSGCDSDDLLQWSPDGKTFTVVKDNTLKLGTPDGKLSNTILEGAEFSRWLPDSKHALVSTGRSTLSWIEVQKLLSRAEQLSVKKMATKVWQKRYIFENQPYQMEALMYLKHTHGNAAFKERFKRLIADTKNMPAFAEIDEIKLVDITDASAPKRQLLWQTLHSISDLRVSPRGDAAAISIRKDDKNEIAILPVAGNRSVVTAATNASNPDWSADGHSLYFVARTQIDDNKTYGEVVNKIPEPYQEKLMRVDITDATGKLLSKVQEPKTIATVLANGTNRVRCLSDGSIIFDASEKTFPSTCDTKPRSLLFRLKPDQKSIEQIPGSAELPINSLDTFEPNKDGTFVACYGREGEVAVLELSTGKVAKLEPANKRELSFSPQWRTNDELCFLSKQDKSAGGHDYDLILQSVSDLNQRTVLSKDWSLNDFPFLKKPEEEKQTAKQTVKTEQKGKTK